MFTSLVQKYRIEIIVVFFLIVLFFFTRLISLTALPIFVDEAIYLRWAQIAKNDANWRFISLTDGKQPLFVWLTLVAMRLIENPLVVGRAVSVLAGLASMLAIWGLAFALFRSKQVAFWAAFLYLISPFALIYDRMALMDSLVGTFSLLSLLLAVLLVKTLRLDVALILGAALGGGALTKTSGFLSIYFLPLTLLLFPFHQKFSRGEKHLGGQGQWKKNKFNLRRLVAKNKFRLLKWAGLALLAVAISQLFYGVLRLSPFFYMIARKDASFVFPLKEWLRDPFYYSASNFRGLADWLITYLTWTLVGLIGVSFLFSWKKMKERFLLLFWFLAPFFALAIFGRILYPRFILFMSLPLLVLAAWGLSEISRWSKNKWLGVLAGVLLLAWPVYLDYQILFEPFKANIARSDYDQYIRSWPAGYGVKEIVDFIERESQDKKIFLATEGTFGLMPAAFELYLWDNPNVEIKGFFPVNQVPLEVIEKAKEKPSFFVFNETQNVPGSWPLELIAEYPRPDPNYKMRLYRVRVD